MQQLRVLRDLHIGHAIQMNLSVFWRPGLIGLPNMGVVPCQPPLKSIRQDDENGE